MMRLPLILKVAKYIVIQVETLSERLFQSERELLQYDAIFYAMCETVLYISNLLQSLSAMFH